MIDNNKVMCFTTSYRRPYHLYNIVNNILNQTYTDIFYAIGVSIDVKQDIVDYKNLLSHFMKDHRVKFYFHNNLEQHENYIYPIIQNNYEEYDIFIKIDDDDIYKSNYIETILTKYNKYKCDVLSCNIKTEINNNRIINGKFDNVGGYWHGDLESNIQFGMPFTYVFNNKALNIILQYNSQQLKAIHPFEDVGWRTKWREHNITSKVLQDSDLAIYNIHGKNISSSQCLLPHTDSRLQNDNYSIIYIKHKWWASHCVIYHQTARLFNIANNDHGSFSINQKEMTINWDKYNTELFVLDENSNIYELSTS